MSLITPRKLSQLCLKNHVVMLTAVRNHWNKDYMPGNVPQTMEERIAAAQKYGVAVEEYKTLPDDGTGNGDYPDIPMESGDSRDPHYPWDNPELKRNFNEVMHADFDMITEDRYDINFRHRTPVRTQLFQFVGVMGVLWGIYLIFENVKQFPGTIPKQYPYQGKTHYLLEPSE